MNLSHPPSELAYPGYSILTTASVCMMHLYLDINRQKTKYFTRFECCQPTKWLLSVAIGNIDLRWNGSTLAPLFTFTVRQQPVVAVVIWEQRRKSGDVDKE